MSYVNKWNKYFTCNLILSYPGKIFDFIQHNNSELEKIFHRLNYPASRYTLDVNKLKEYLERDEIKKLPEGYYEFNCWDYIRDSSKIRIVNSILCTKRLRINDAHEKIEYWFIRGIKKSRVEFRSKGGVVKHWVYF